MNNNTIIEAAWLCWKQSIDAIEFKSDCELESSPDWVVSNGMVQFSNPEAIANYAALYVYRHIILPQLESPKALFNSLFDVWKIKATDRRLPGVALSIAHNNTNLDIFEFAVNSLEFSHTVFRVIHILEGAIPKIDHLNIKSLVAWQVKVHEDLKKDLMGGRLFESLIPWMSENINIAYEIIEWHLNNPIESTAPLYKAALISIGKKDADHALKLVQEHVLLGQVLISSPAIESMGNYDYRLANTKALYIAALDYVDNLINDEALQDLHSVASFTLGNLVSLEITNHTRLNKLVSRNDSKIYYSLSEFLFRNVNEHCDKGWFINLFIGCAKVSIADTGTLNNLDVILHCYAEKAYDTVAERFLELWLINQELPNADSLDLEAIFDSAIITLLTANKLSSLFTRWMASDSRNLIYGAFNLMHISLINKSFHRAVFEYDIDQLNAMTYETIELLVFRTLGYVYEVDPLISMLWSLTKVKRDRQKVWSLFEHVFMRHISYDYPGETLNFLEKEILKKMPKGLKEICQKIINSIKYYQEKLDSLPDLKEMRTAYSKRRIISREKQKQMNRAQDEASKKSIIQQLANTIHLKAGTSSFSVNGNRPSEKMHLSSHSYSYTLPRSELIDPVGANRMRLIYRNGIRSKS